MSHICQEHVLRIPYKEITKHNVHTSRPQPCNLFKHRAETRTQNMFEWISLHDNCLKQMKHVIENEQSMRLRLVHNHAFTTRGIVSTTAKQLLRQWFQEFVHVMI